MRTILRNLRRTTTDAPAAQIPYPPVFKDVSHPWQRVSTSSDIDGVCVEQRVGEHEWKRTTLTETDACLLAASLLARAGRDDLSAHILADLGSRKA